MSSVEGQRHDDFDENDHNHVSDNDQVSETVEPANYGDSNGNDDGDVVNSDVNIDDSHEHDGDNNGDDNGDEINNDDSHKHDDKEVDTLHDDDGNNGHDNTQGCGCNDNVDDNDVDSFVGLRHQIRRPRRLQQGFWCRSLGFDCLDCERDG